MMQYCFLLDSYRFQDSLNTVWEHCAPKIYPLFATTLLDHYKEQGPLLITGDIQFLIYHFRIDPENWPGLLIKTQATDDELLMHLRRLLFVTYPPESKGVLTYYDRHTAGYLFHYTEQDCLSDWLGPMQSLEWYGGTWRQQMDNSLSWQCVRSPSDNGEKYLSEYASLTKGQQEGLTIARQEKYVYDWSQNHDQTYDMTHQHLQEAISLGFDDLTYLERYLTLRAKYWQSLTPIQLTGNSAKQRLQNLENFWQNGRI